MREAEEAGARQGGGAGLGGGEDCPPQGPQHRATLGCLDIRALAALLVRT